MRSVLLLGPLIAGILLSSGAAATIAPKEAPSTDKEFHVLPFWVRPANPTGDKWNIRLRGYTVHKRSGLSVRFTAMLAIVNHIIKDKITDEHKKTFKERSAWTRSSKSSELLTVSQLALVDKAGKQSQSYPVQSYDGDKTNKQDINMELVVPPDFKRDADHLRVVLQLNSGREVRVNVPFIDDRGFMVISDLDDTIRDSRVLHRPTYLMRYYYEKYTALPGAAQLYQSIYDKLSAVVDAETHKAYPATFLYLSASSYELYPAFRGFLKENKFPGRSLLMANVRLLAMVDMLRIKLRKYKREGTAFVIGQYSKKKFLLSGDSGQMDPESYGDVVRMYPSLASQVDCILIRQVEGVNAKVEAVKNTKERFALAFQGVPPTKWRVFKDSQQLMNVPFGTGTCYAPGETNEWAMDAADVKTTPEGAVLIDEPLAADAGSPITLAGSLSGLPKPLAPVVKVFELRSDLADQVVPA